MPNSNTAVQAISSAGKFCPSAAGGVSSTAEFQFQDSAGNPLVLFIPGSNRLKNRPFRVRMWGRVKTAGSYNCTAILYVGSSATIGSNTALATSGTVASNGTGAFMFELRGIWESGANAILGDFQGFFCGSAGGTIKGQTIIGTLTQPNVAPSAETVALTCTFTLGTSNAANTVTLDGFELEVM